MRIPLLSRLVERKYSPAGTVISASSVGQAVWTERNYHDLSTEGYVRNPIVKRCVKLISAGAANVPWLLTSRDGKKTYPNHPLLDLLRNPGGNQIGVQLMEAYYAYLLLAGNAYLTVPTLSGGRPPKELWTLRPDRMTVIAGPYGLPMAFEYEANGQKMSYPVNPVTGQSDVLHVKDFHPTNDWYGMSSIEPSAYGVDRHTAASKHAKALLDNGARPTGMMVFEPVTVNGQVQNASQNLVDVAEAKLRDRNVGAANAGKPMVLSGNVKWYEMAITPREMDFMKGKEDSARDICYGLGVPDILVVPGQSTYNNISEAKLDLWEQTILPLIGIGVGGLNNWLVPRFGDDLLLYVDLDQVSSLEPRRTAKRKSVGELYRSGIIDADEAREELQYGKRVPGTIRLQRGDGQIIASLMTSAQASDAMLHPLYNYMVSVGLVNEDDLSFEEFQKSWQDSKDNFDLTTRDGQQTAVSSLLRENVPPGTPRIAGSSVNQIGGGGKKSGSDMRSLYVRRPVLNGRQIADWAKSQGIRNVVDPSEMHVTIAYSKEPMDWNRLDAQGGSMSVPSGSEGRQVKALGPNKDVTALGFQHDPLESRWRDFRVRGASWDWPSYQPHVTISTSAQKKDLGDFEPYKGEIVLGPEEFDEVDEGAGAVRTGT